MRVRHVLGDLRRRIGLQRLAVAGRTSATEEIRSDPRFRDGLDQIATQLGLDLGGVAADADRYLREMVTVHSEALPDFNLLLSRIADRRGFDGVIQCDDEAIERLRVINRTSPLVMMTAHRSYLDFVVRVPFAQRGFEREYRFAGANIAFWPMGAIGRSAGIIFVRRGFRDPVYSFVLRQYVGWLAEHRASFLWAIEGGRTRTGKLLAPKVGLLAYLAQAYADGRSSDVTLVPGTVVYEHLNEVFEYARYGRGASKSGESLLSFVTFWWQQRHVPPDARINVGVGEPVSLGDFIERGADAEGLSDGIVRASVEVSRRIDAATPISPVALVLLPLLERDGVGMTVDELTADLVPIHRRIALRRLPVAPPGAQDASGVRRALELLRAQGLVEASGSGARQQYAVAAGRHVEAAYHRNAIVHFFAIRAIAEIAVARTAHSRAGRRVVSFWEEVDRLHDLLGHEFFFPEAELFQGAVSDELHADVGDWETTLEASDGVALVLEALGRPVAPLVLAPFLEAYKLVAEELRRLGSQKVVDERRLASDCLARGNLLLLLGRLRRPDAVSLHMFETPLVEARERGLLEGGSAEGRGRFAGTIDDALLAVAVLETPDRCRAVSERA